MLSRGKFGKLLLTTNYPLLYSYIDANGQNVVVRYRAGKDGFVILNPDDILPKPPQAY